MKYLWLKFIWWRIYLFCSMIYFWGMYIPYVALKGLFMVILFEIKKKK